MSITEFGVSNHFIEAVREVSRSTDTCLGSWRSQNGHRGTPKDAFRGRQRFQKMLTGPFIAGMLNLTPLCRKFKHLSSWHFDVSPVYIVAPFAL